MNRLLIYGGILLALVVGVWGYGVWNYGVGKTDGIAQERAVWEEAQRKLQAQMDAERRAAQQKIDEIERQYLAEKDRDRRNIESLEQAIKDMEADNAADSNRPSAVVPRGVVRQLDKIGK